MSRKSTIILAALLALGGVAEARAQQQGPQHGMMMGMDPDDWRMMSMMMQMRGMMGQGPMMPMMGPGQHVEGQLAFFKTELKITPAQEQLWSAFAETVRANAQKMAGVMPCCDGPQGGIAQGGMMQNALLKLPERLEWQEKFLAARLDALRSMRGALTPLYAAFSDEQKQTADQLIQGPWEWA